MSIGKYLIIMLLLFFSFILLHYILEINIFVSLFVSLILIFIVLSIPGKKRIINTVLIKILGENIIINIRNQFERFSPVQQQEIIKRTLFYQQFVNKNDLCFDVGANVGNRITPLLKIGAKVLAVEPQESCYKVLQSKFGDKITLVTKGLGEKECMRKFHICNANTISSFSEEWINSLQKTRFKEYSWDRIIEVEMTTLDNLIEKYGVPAFIKIDVEGYESEVLRGLSHPINMISFEYTVPEQTHKIEQCIKIVEKTNPNIRCNFSIGESMEWSLTKWLSVSEFLKLIKNKDFINTSWGDIYLKSV